jgi:hypothetical protein
MGNDVLASRDAWRAYQTMLADERLVFAAEPFGVEAEWKKVTAQNRPTPKTWTNAYLRRLRSDCRDANGNSRPRSAFFCERGVAPRVKRQNTLPSLSSLELIRASIPAA